MKNLSKCSEQNKKAKQPLPLGVDAQDTHNKDADDEKDDTTASNDNHSPSCADHISFIKLAPDEN